MSLAEVEEEPFDVDRIEGIAARLDLRLPNKQALESIVYETARHYDIDREPPPFEAVVDVATGVGKTYVLAAAIEYFAADGVRNFAVITPGRTILQKTQSNFTVGHPKSLLGGMEVRPVVITSDNFATPAMRAAMDDPEQVKVYIFTVQALLKPESQTGRKVHKFQEGLGEAFYAHLQSLDDLVVFADEHHAYYGEKFSAAVRNLRPRVLLGLTATPDKKTPPGEIIFRYPLAAAIADKLVKTPVLVGRRDDRIDPETKLLDGVRLLELKQQAIVGWCEGSGAEAIPPMMLVIAPDIQEAEEIRGIVDGESFAGGRYSGKVLTVHSKQSDEALAELGRLEEPGSPYRIVISVGMLKEGWDVKNVYVIASMRASVSDMLTEQTLGRGLRLPFGEYTGVEILDTLEVLGHERYEDLLRKAGVLNEQFIDRRTRAVLRQNAAGRLVPVRETTTVEASVVPIIQAGGEREAAEGTGTLIESVEAYTAKAEEQVVRLQEELAPRSGVVLRIPLLRMTEVKAEFSLADITNRDAFRRFGESIAADPVGSLRRITLGAKIVEGADGLRHTELVTTEAIDRIESPASLLPLDDLREALIGRVLVAPIVPARAKERRSVSRIVEQFMEGLGNSADTLLSAYMDRAAGGLIQVITDELRKFAVKPTYGEVTELTTFAKTRIGRAETTGDRYGDFRGKKGVGFEGFTKSLYSQDWFDSSTERDVANILEDEPAITLWVRLQIGDLPILWTGAHEYNPDFIAVDSQGTHWVVEVKMDKDMETPAVRGKREAALRWANHVSDDDKVDTTWRYILVSETDVKTAKGSWDALKALGA